MSGINKFRTEQYRVFLAEPYFKLDLKKEIDWNKKHLCKLRLQARNPDLFHNERTSHIITDDHHRHFQEHVIDSIPFHEQILNDHKKRLSVLDELLDKKSYNKIRSITEKTDFVPKYFIYNKKSKDFFFACDSNHEKLNEWSKLAEKKKICKVEKL